MHIAGPSRPTAAARHAAVPATSAGWPRAFRPAWWALVVRSVRTPVGHGPTEPQLAATANGRPPASRRRGVLLPHAPTEPSATRASNRRTGRAHDMNRDGSPRHHQTPSDGTTRGAAASTQWHDAELAMKVARHS